MKKISLLLFFLLFSLGINAQTATELLGKWKLVKWTQNGKEKNIPKHFKTEEVYQVFLDDNEFQSLIGDKTKKGKWHLSKNNANLTITSALVPVKFNIVFFDPHKRVIKHTTLGTLEYAKIE